MSAEVYRLQIGKLKCAIVSDGTAALIPNLAKIMFASAPEDELVQALKQHNIDGYEIPYRMNCLYVNTGKHQVLIDTGFGAGVNPDLGRLVDSLRMLEVVPEDIDTLILTHGHPDHIGGNTDQDGKLTFLNARHVMWKAEWEFWTSEEELAKLSEGFVHFARAKLPPIKNKLELIDGEAEIVPGIRVVPAPGHTPGHIALSIISQDEELLHIVDTVTDPIHMEHPDWIAPVDILPEQTIATRRKILARAATDQPLVLAYHFAFPGLGHVTTQSNAWAWQPI